MRYLANRGSRATGETARGHRAAGVSRRLRSESGQAVIEFAMVLPILCALVFVIVDFGKAVYYYIDLTHIANEGARIAAVAPSALPGGSPSLKAYLCSQLGSGSSELQVGSSVADRATVAISYPSGTQKAGDPVRVVVSTAYHWIPFFGGGSMAISGAATMRLEQPTTGNALLAGGQC
jgi:Flp pilus assembly protein TadG